MLTREQMLAYLHQHRPVIAPSMLKCDFGDLNTEIQRIDAAQLPLYHWDVMDGHFVPNLSYGAMVIAEARKRTAVPFDAHLMISDPASYVDEYIQAGCEAITFHLEAVPEPVSLLESLKAKNVVAGLAINPGTPFEQVEPFLETCDMLLIMSVNPGFGGQSFIADVLPKMQAVRKAAGDRLIISVDGGIATGTIGKCAAAGSDVFVAGSSIFNENDYEAAGQALKNEAVASDLRA